LRVLNETFDKQLHLEQKGSAPLAGGIMQYGYQCGMIWGAVLAAGAQAFERFGAGQEAEVRAIMAAQKLVETFQACTGEINCSEITDIDKSSSTLKMIYVFLIKGKTLGCIRLSGKYAPKAFKVINEVFAEEQIEIPNTPVSCAAELARKMGATEKQAVMAAGLAGGIGLCGGACGALGAAIWILTMNKGEDSKLEFNDPKMIELIEKSFLTNSDYEFDCSDIVGKKFENIADHANFLKVGGCSKIIEALAASASK
jgi:putative redox-active protein with C_GCAxxG_C_C motif